MTNVLRNEGRKQSKIIGRDFRALVIDIETRPNHGWFYRLYDERIGINQIEEPHSMMCFAAKWLGDPDDKIIFRSELGRGGREAMVKTAWKLVDEADAIIHYNGVNFDMKHLRTEFILQGLTKPSPHKDIDLLKVVRKNFKFPSNALKYVAPALGVGTKVETGGFELWRSCLEGSLSSRKKAMNQMKEYNIGDIAVTESVYYKVLSYIDNHPNVGLYTGEHDCCDKCGSTSYQRRGFVRTNANVFQRFCCKDCGSWFRRARSEAYMKTKNRSAR